jgi:predicted NACHT family NTPase
MGEPGAGKSTLLLELTRTLLKQTVQNEQLPIPVVFNLSTWAQKRRELSEWLVEELWLRYDVSRSIGKVWVEADRILPLLDGLDEVEESSRPACVQAINSYSQQHLGRPLVTCCRTAEYHAQATHVRLNKAVEVQPLTNRQVAQYLDSAGGKLEGVRMLIKRDAEIRELARTPLMLSILALTNYDTMPKLPGTRSLEMRRRQIFATYVQQMLSRRGRLKSGSAQQIMYWLTWLAGQMKRHQPPLSEFYLEQLQSDWLPNQNIQAW